MISEAVTTSQDIATLTIGVNALYLLPGRVGGTEIYLRGLLDALAAIDNRNRYVVFTNREAANGFVPCAPNFEAVHQPINAVFRPARIVWEQTGLAISVARRHLDVLLNPGVTSPVACGCPMVTVVHDLQHKRHPEYFRWFDLPFWRLLVWVSIHSSAAVIAPSVTTAADILRYYSVNRNKVHVVQHGVDPQMFAMQQRSPARRVRKEILSVSTLHPHKNFDLLIRAFAKFRVHRPDFNLVIVGLEGFAAASLKRLVARLGLEQSVHLTGWIPRQQVYRHFRNAFSFIHPSLFEGFGMSVLEALAAGVPSACSAIEPLISITGSSCLYFDPTKESEILDALCRLTSDLALRHELELRGPQIAKRYSWRASAQATLDILAKVARRRDLPKPRVSERMKCFPL
jgi:glycosyltransferase involved in cell wall biosynthesis